MIDLYTYRTSNGRKVSIMLEECGLAYETHIVDITAGEQDAPAFRTINPNGRIPAIVDRDGPGGKPLALFESGAVLLYLGDKSGKFVPPVDDVRGRYVAIQWLMWQMGGVGPNFGQAFHFLHQHSEGAPADAIAYGRERYGGEVRRLCSVMDARLEGARYLAGDDYGIADIATFPWVALHTWFGLDLAETPALRRWYDEIRERPAVRRGMDVPTREGMEEHARRRGVPQTN
jgi:GST-like protein